MKKNLTNEEKSDIIIENFVKGLREMTFYKNSKMNNSYADVNMVASSVFGAQNNKSTSRGFNNAVFSGTALAVSVLFLVLIGIILLFAVNLINIISLVIISLIICITRNKQNAELFVKQ